jgi:uncharacterized protein YdeI (YjbR/CyaY-like superfamily)
MQRLQQLLLFCLVSSLVEWVCSIYVPAADAYVVLCLGLDNYVLFQYRHLVLDTLYCSPGACCKW